MEWIIQNLAYSAKIENPYPEFTAAMHPDQENGQMFERDPFGLNPNLTSQNRDSRMTSSRHALSKQRYLEEKSARLTDEASERKRQDIEAETEAAVSALGRILQATRAAIMSLKSPQRVLGN